MKIAAVTILSLGLLGASACVRTATTPAAPTRQDVALASGVEAVAYGGERAVRAGDIRLERTDAGSVRAVWSSAGVPARAKLTDAALEAAVRGRLATDGMLATSRIDVDADGTTVKLAGDVRTREEAARAIRIALEAGGARVVESRLTWVPERELARLRAAARHH